MTENKQWYLQLKRIAIYSLAVILLFSLSFSPVFADDSKENAQGNLELNKNTITITKSWVDSELGFNGFYIGNTDYSDIYPTSGKITLVYVENGKIRMKKKGTNTWSLNEDKLYAGTHTVVCEDAKGNIATVKVIVKEACVKKLINVSSYLEKSRIYYGDKLYSGSSDLPNTKVKVAFNGVTYRTKTKKCYMQDIGSWTEFSCKMPVWKLKKKLNVRITLKWNGTTVVKKRHFKVRSRTSTASTGYSRTGKIYVGADYLHKGDKIKLKIGKKTYTRKIKRDIKSKTFVFRIGKKYKAYKAFRVRVYNKYRQKLCGEADSLWYDKNDPYITYAKGFSKVGRVRVTVKNPHKGEILKVKIGSKTFKRKITKTRRKVRFKINIGKHWSPGKKVTVNLYSKLKQRLDKDTFRLYYSTKLKKGMTKKQCRWVPGWEHPAEKYYTSDSETWWYDDDDDGYATDSYLYFYHGKLEDWYY